MLFHVRMDVNIPHDMDPVERDKLVASELAYSHELQRRGTWVHVWRVVGQFTNFSVFDVASTDELHDILWNLPLFPFMKIQVTPLAKHHAALD